MTLRLIPGLLLVALACSCNWPLTAGTIDRLSAVRDVEMPDTVRAGERFEVAFLSATGDPRWASGGDEVRSQPGGILIVPRDRFHDADATVAVVSQERHVVPLELSRVGQREVRIRSRVYVPDGRDTVETLVFPLTVLP